MYKRMPVAVGLNPSSEPLSRRTASQRTERFALSASSGASMSTNQSVTPLGMLPLIVGRSSRPLHTSVCCSR